MFAVLVLTSRRRQILLTGPLLPLPAEVSTHASDKQNVRDKPGELKTVRICLFFKHLCCIVYEIRDLSKRVVVSFMCSVYLKIPKFRVRQHISYTSLP